MKRYLVFSIIALFPLFINGQEVLKIPKITDAEGPHYNVELDAFVIINGQQIKIDTNSIKLIETKWIKKIEILKDAKYKELHGDKNGKIMIYPKKKFNKAIINKLEIKN
jgi:hypothetical protein